MWKSQNIKNHSSGHINKENLNRFEVKTTCLKLVISFWCYQHKVCYFVSLCQSQSTASNSVFDFILSSSWKKENVSCSPFDHLTLADIDLTYLRQGGRGCAFFSQDMTERDSMRAEIIQLRSLAATWHWPLTVQPQPAFFFIHSFCDRRCVRACVSISCGISSSSSSSSTCWSLSCGEQVDAVTPAIFPLSPFFSCHHHSHFSLSAWCPCLDDTSIRPFRLPSADKTESSRLPWLTFQEQTGKYDARWSNCTLSPLRQ